MRWIGVGMVLVVALVVAVFGWRGKRSTEPPIQLIPDMKQQPIYHAQGEGPFFADRRELRTPVAGTVPFGGLDYAADAGHPTANADMLQEDSGYYRGLRSFEPRLAQSFAAATMALDGTLGDGSPLTALVLLETTARFWNTAAQTWVTRIPGQGTAERRITLEFLDRGQEKYNMSCALCHGVTGRANGITTQYEMKGVANLHDPRIRDMPDGQLFHVVVHGKGNMKGYGWLLKPEDRWAVVAYVRVLQRSQRATEADLPPQERERFKR